jgi:hypothetical protein
MAYECPRCGEPVQRGVNATAGAAGGAVGALIASAFGSFHCQKCGPIARREFPSDVRRKMTLQSVVLVLVALLLLVGLIAFLIFIKQYE